MFYTDGNLITEYNWSPSTKFDSNINPAYCKIVKKFEAGGYKVETISSETLEGVLQGASIRKVRIVKCALRGGGGYSTPNDATLHTTAGDFSTTKSIAMSLVSGISPKEESVTNFIGAGYSYNVYDLSYPKE